MTLNPHRYADLGATTRGGGASGGSSIGPSHTGALQLHQLRAIDALYRDRSVTLAAARLCITPSAVSHSLRRLRDLLGDELFRRTRDGMEPTERAHAIIPAIREALGLLDSAFDASFDPAVAGREFRIAGLLSMRMLLAPVLGLISLPVTIVLAMFGKGAALTICAVKEDSAARRELP